MPISLFIPWELNLLDFLARGFICCFQIISPHHVTSIYTLVIPHVCLKAWCSLPLELPISKQIWRSPLGESNSFLPYWDFQKQAGRLPLRARRRLDFPASYEPSFPGSGKSGYWRSFLRGFFHGAGAETRDPIAQGKENHMDKSLFSRRPLSETYSVRNVLDSYGDTPVCARLSKVWS